MKTRNKNNCLFLNLWLLWYFSSVLLKIYTTTLRMRCDLILNLIYDRKFFFLCIIKAKSVINFIVCFQKKKYIFMIVIRSYLPNNNFYLNMALAYTCLLLSFINILQIDIKMYYCNYNNWCLFCRFFSSCCVLLHTTLNWIYEYCFVHPIAFHLYLLKVINQHKFSTLLLLSITIIVVVVLLLLCIYIQSLELQPKTARHDYSNIMNGNIVCR